MRRKQGSRAGGYLQVLDAELVPVHVNGRQEDGLHLVVAQLVGGQVGSNENLGKEKGMSQKGGTLGHQQGAVTSRQQQSAPSLRRQPDPPGVPQHPGDASPLPGLICVCAPFVLLAIPHGAREQLQSSSISACDLAAQSCQSWGLPARLLIGKQSWRGAAVGRPTLEPCSAPEQGREQAPVPGIKCPTWRMQRQEMEAACRENEVEEQHKDCSTVPSCCGEVQ